jgi:molybdopterin-guanine dinucleotide biosynthesis protein A
MVAAAILAGGRAMRLGGRDKASLPFGDLRLIERQIAALHAVTADVFIVTNQPGRYAALGLPAHPDLRPGTGALGGIYSAILASPAAQTLVVACDLPFLSADFLGHLAARGRDTDLAIPRSAGGYEPLCASYSRACSEPIARLLDAGRLKVAGVMAAGLRVVEIAPDECARFDPDGMLFLNVNTPDDYARARAWLDRRAT